MTNAVLDLIMRTYSALIPLLLGYLVYLLKSQIKVRDANSKGTMLLLRVQLIEYHKKYTELKYIPTYAYENFVEMYEAYHALGGNGMVEKLNEDIQDLKILNKKGEN